MRSIRLPMVFVTLELRFLGTVDDPMPPSPSLERIL